MLGLEAIEEWSCANARRNSVFEGTPISDSSLSESTSETRLWRPSRTTRREKAEMVWFCKRLFCVEGWKRLEIILRKVRWVVCWGCDCMTVSHSSAVRASNRISVLGRRSVLAVWRTEGISPDMREMRPSTR